MFIPSRPLNDQIMLTYIANDNQLPSTYQPECWRHQKIHFQRITTGQIPWHALAQSLINFQFHLYQLCIQWSKSKIGSCGFPGAHGIEWYTIASSSISQFEYGHLNTGPGLPNQCWWGIQCRILAGPLWPGVPAAATAEKYFCDQSRQASLFLAHVEHLFCR